MGDDRKPSQLDKFRDLARELEADEDADRFEETVRKIAPRTPPASDEAKSGD